MPDTRTNPYQYQPPPSSQVTTGNPLQTATNLIGQLNPAYMFLTEEEARAYWANNGVADPTENQLIEFMLSSITTPATETQQSHKQNMMPIGPYVPPSPENRPDDPRTPSLNAHIREKRLAKLRELIDRYYTLQETAMQIFNHKIDLTQAVALLASGASDTQILAEWRNSDEYMQIFIDKPGYMSESEYRQKADKMMAEGDRVRSDFATYAGVNLTDADLRKIYIGGTDSSNIRDQYLKVQAGKASYQGMLGRLQTTGVQNTNVGPVEPTLGAGVIANANNNNGSYGGMINSPVTTNPVISPMIPITEMYSTYQDYQQGRVNPNFTADFGNP